MEELCQALAHSSLQEQPSLHEIQLRTLVLAFMTVQGLAFEVGRRLVRASSSEFRLSLGWDPGAVFQVAALYRHHLGLRLEVGGAFEEIQSFPRLYQVLEALVLQEGQALEWVEGEIDPVYETIEGWLREHWSELGFLFS